MDLDTNMFILNTLHVKLHATNGSAMEGNVITRGFRPITKVDMSKFGTTKFSITDQPITAITKSVQEVMATLAHVFVHGRTHLVAYHFLLAF